MTGTSRIELSHRGVLAGGTNTLDPMTLKVGTPILDKHLDRLPVVA